MGSHIAPCLNCGTESAQDSSTACRVTGASCVVAPEGQRSPEPKPVHAMRPDASLLCGSADRGRGAVNIAVGGLLAGIDVTCAGCISVMYGGPIPDAAQRSPTPQPDADASRGWYRKYDVKRCNDPEGKHTDCEYFVLDLEHDKHAPAALRAYAFDCAETFPKLAADLRRRFGIHVGAPSPDPCTGCKAVNAAYEELRADHARVCAALGLDRSASADDLVRVLAGLSTAFDHVAAQLDEARRDRDRERADCIEARKTNDRHCAERDEAGNAAARVAELENRNERLAIALRRAVGYVADVQRHEAEARAILDDFAAKKAG